MGNDEKGELTALEREVLDGLREHEILARNPEVQFESGLTFRRLRQKLDRILSHPWERLVEIQEIHTKLIQEIRSRRQSGGPPRKGSP